MGPVEGDGPGSAGRRREQIVHPDRMVEHPAGLVGRGEIRNCLLLDALRGAEGPVDRPLRVVLDRIRCINAIEDVDGEYIIVGEFIIAMLGNANFTLGDELSHPDQGIAHTQLPDPPAPPATVNEVVHRECRQPRHAGAIVAHAGAPKAGPREAKLRTVANAGRRLRQCP